MMSNPKQTCPHCGAEISNKPIPSQPNEPFVIQIESIQLKPFFLMMLAIALGVFLGLFFYSIF